MKSSSAASRGQPVVGAALKRGSIVLWLLLAGCGDGSDSASPEPTTVAYIQSSCTQTGFDMTLQQDVRILHGDSPAVTAITIGPLGPFSSTVCGFQGANRYSLREFGPVQRFGITPDGSGVVFEVTDKFVRPVVWELPAEQMGIWYVRADGSGLRRLGPASRSPSTYYTPGGVPFVGLSLDFDPDGKQFAYIDRGLDEAGHDGSQIFVQALALGARSRQVTQLPALDLPGEWPEVSGQSFIDSHTILFRKWIQPPSEATYGTADIDGAQVHDLPVLVVPGGEVIPIFSITGEDRFALTSPLPGEPENPLADRPIREVFVTDGGNVLQLTNFRRVDTAVSSAFYSKRDERVYLTASADPFGTNPRENCQIFSIDPRGGDLRQLTSFAESAARGSCFGSRSEKACGIYFGYTSHASQNPHTGTIFFSSSCDPLGRNPNGYQVFSMQPDGSDLRQLTDARGGSRQPDGTYHLDIIDAFLSAPY